MTSTGSMVKPGIIRCVPSGGYVEAEILVKGKRTIAELQQLQKRVIDDEHFTSPDYSACAALSDVAGKPALKITVRFPQQMSAEAQTEHLKVFVFALAPFAEVKGFDMTQLATQPTVH